MDGDKKQGKNMQETKKKNGLDIESFQNLQWELRYRLVNNSHRVKGHCYSVLINQVVKVALSDENIHIRRKAATKYASSPHFTSRLTENEIIPAIKKAKSPEEVAQYIELLSFVGHQPKSNKKHCIKWLKRNDSVIKIAALKVLSRWHYHELKAVEKIQREMKNKDWKVRLFAYKALKKMIQLESQKCENPNLFNSTIITALNDERVDCQAWALQILRSKERLFLAYPSEIQQRVVELVESKNNEVRGCAYEIKSSFSKNSKWDTIEMRLQMVKQMEAEKGFIKSTSSHQRSYQFLSKVISENSERTLVYGDFIKVAGLSGLIWLVGKNSVGKMCKKQCCITDKACLNVKGVPEGDRIATFVMSLLNDIESGKKIQGISRLIKSGVSGCNYSWDRSRSGRYLSGQSMLTAIKIKQNLENFEFLQPYNGMTSIEMANHINETKDNATCVDKEGEDRV